MIIQNTNTNQVEQPVRRVTDNVAGVVVNTTNAEPSFSVEPPQTAARQLALQQPSPEQLKHAVDNINQAMRQSSHGLEFSVDSDTHKLIVKIVDSETGELIRQIPSEETLAISRSIDRFQQGLLLNQKA